MVGGMFICLFSISKKVDSKFQREKNHIPYSNLFTSPWSQKTVLLYI